VVALIRLHDVVALVNKAIEKGVLFSGEERIDISIVGKSRTLTIEDNGYGIFSDKIERLLCSLGYSEKDSRNYRGFRGIGRLGGLAYCKRLLFTTRALGEEDVAQVEWDGSRLSSAINEVSNSSDLTSVIVKLAQIKFRKATKSDPTHFFRVTMEEISRFYDDSLLNIENVKSYLTSIAPVPYNESTFTFSNEVKEHFSGISGWRSYLIYLNGYQIHKAYRDEINFSITRIDTIKGVELFEIRDVDDNLIGRGWYAITSLIGAIPKSEKIRGIRIRQGNIEIGNEEFFREIYTEARFAVWHIGEIELIRGVRPNARRDGFEQTTEYERVLAFMNIFGRRLSSVCRKASYQRNQLQRLNLILDRVEKILSYYPIFVDYDHAESVIYKASLLLGKVRKVALNGMKNKEIERKYHKLLHLLKTVRNDPPVISNCIDGRLLGKGCSKRFLENLCRRVVNNGETDENVANVLSCILKPYLRMN